MKTGGQEILTIAEMALADKLTIEGGVAEARLIAAAGGQLARAICRMSLPGRSDCRVLRCRQQRGGRICLCA